MKDIFDSDLFNSSKLFNSPLFAAWENEMKEIDKILARKKTLDRISILEQSVKVLTKRLDETQAMNVLSARFLLLDPERRKEWERFKDENRQKQKK